MYGRSSIDGVVGAARGTRKLAARRIALRQSASPVSRAVSSSTTARNLRRRPSGFAAPPDTKRLAAPLKVTKTTGGIERKNLRIGQCEVSLRGIKTHGGIEREGLRMGWCEDGRDGANCVSTLFADSETLRCAAFSCRFVSGERQFRVRRGETKPAGCGIGLTPAEAQPLCRAESRRRNRVAIRFAASAFVFRAAGAPITDHL